MVKPILSIVVVNFETPDYTLQCLRSIQANPPSCPHEIILIDNGSEDGTLELVRAQVPGVICIETGQNWGFAKANNLGIRNAQGKFVLLLNSDTKILDDSLDRLLRYIEKLPEVGAVGPRQLDGEGKLQLSWGHFPTLVSETFRKLLHHRLSFNDLRIRDYLEEKYSESTRVDWISGSCLLARREVLLQAGLLDEHFFMYFEDIDLCRRIRDTGHEIHYHAEPTLIHYGGISAKKNLARIFVEYRRSQIHFTRKYYGRRGETILRILLLIKYFFNSLRWAGAHCVNLIRQSGHESSYAKLLVCKKTLELVLTADRTQSHASVDVAKDPIFRHNLV